MVVEVVVANWWLVGFPKGARNEEDPSGATFRWRDANRCAPGDEVACASFPSSPVLWPHQLAGITGITGLTGLGGHWAPPTTDSTDLCTHYSVQGTMVKPSCSRPNKRETVEIFD